MEVTLAKTAGFCFGVKRAVEKVYEQLEDNDGARIYTYGPIIHNEQVVEDLKSRGVIVIEDDELIDNMESGTVIIRSHGVPKGIIDRLEKRGCRIVDATCPFVKKIHKIVSERTKEGYHVVIIGNDKHPEVEGIKGWACGSGSVSVIENADEAEKFKAKDTNLVCIVSQTTFNYNKFKELVEIISKKSYDIIVLNTICNATEERQSEAANLARESDAMIVIGGRHSSNTQKLFEISKKECENTYYIQTLGDLDLQKLKSVRNVGITAGASTPNTIIQEVFDNVRRIKL